MGFDKNTEGAPVVAVEKKTTKVNISMVAGVILFLLLGVVGMLWVSHRSPTHASNLQPNEQSADAPK